ncbi:MAG: hypothetical protein Q9213_008417 [Squamulea squamosa]
MEAIAIIGCIAAVVSAYKDGGAIVDKIKQKRLAKQAPPPTRLLEESLARGPRAVQEAKENGIDRFGSRYAQGDKLALDSLKDILIDLQGSLIRHLRRAQEDDNMADFGTLVDASDIGRIRTVTALHELYMRVALGATTIGPTITQRPFGELGTFSNPQLAIQKDPITPGMLSNVPMHIIDSTVTQSADGIEHNSDTPQVQPASPSRQLPERRTTPRTGIFDRFRRRSSTEESHSGRNSARSSDDKGSTSEGLHLKNLSTSPLTSPQASIDEDNPWVTESTVPNPVISTATVDQSMSRASTLVASTMEKPSTTSRKSSASTARMLSPYEVHGGFCKGAYRLQVHEKDAMKLRNQSTAQTGEGYYWACCSSKCAFEGPANYDGRNRGFDNTVRESHGIRYRWSFLAKAHVTLSKVQNGRYDYGCVFCIYDGFKCPVFHGIKDFMEHVGTHRGKSIAETMLQRIKCINDRVATLDEDYDVNLTPLEIPPKSSSISGFSQLSQPSMQSASARDRVSWSTSNETMADVDPWRDAT